jgi:hypothetical protein
VEPNRIAPHTYSIVITTRFNPCPTHLTHVRQDVGIFKGPPGTTRVEAADIPAHMYVYTMVYQVPTVNHTYG